MRLSTKARYGLRAICHIAHRGYASAHVIAEQQSIPSRYLEEIIGELRKAGLVIGKRGPRGGYRLSRPANEIVVADIIAALSSGPAAVDADSPRDAISDLVERAVDRRFKIAIEALDLESLLEEARDSFRRNAANFVI